MSDKPVSAEERVKAAWDNRGDISLNFTEMVAMVDLHAREYAAPLVEHLHAAETSFFYIKNLSHIEAICKQINSLARAQEEAIKSALARFQKESK